MESVNDEWQGEDYDHETLIVVSWRDSVKA